MPSRATGMASMAASGDECLHRRRGVVQMAHPEEAVGALNWNKKCTKDNNAIKKLASYNLGKHNPHHTLNASRMLQRAPGRN